MMRRFEITFVRQGAGLPEKYVQTAETSEQAVRVFRKAMQHTTAPIDVTDILDLCLPIIDWTKPTFTKEEAREYLCRDIDTLLAAGKLKRATDGRPIFARAALDELAKPQEAA